VTSAYIVNTKNYGRLAISTPSITVKYHSARGSVALL